MVQLLRGIVFSFFLFCFISQLTGQPACVPTNCCCGGVQQIDVPNGDFEGPPFPPPTSWTTYFAGQTFGSWTVVAGSIDHMGSNTTGFNDGNPNGPSQHIDLNGNTNATITNTLTGMTAGYSYTIVLWYAKNPCTPVANCNILVANGAWLNETWSSTNDGDDIWLEKCFTFTALGPTAELRFSGTSNVSACGMLLDDITMWECPDDAQAPVVTNPPAPFLTFSCPTLVPPPPVLNVTDNCTNNPDVIFTENTTPKDCYFSVERVWEITDECNNVTTFTQNIDVQDNVAPIFTVFPTGMTVACGSNSFAVYESWMQNNGGAAANDNCDQDLEWVVSPLLPFNQACGVYPVSFMVVDDCFNTTTRTAQFIVLDNVPPTLLQPALNDTIICPVSPADSLAQWLAVHGGAIASDSCGAVSWTNNFSGSAGDSVLVVTFTATDPCGNSVSTTASFVQYTANDTITINNTTCDPQLVGESITTITQGLCTNVLVTTTTLAPSDSISFSSVTCDPALAGTFTQNLTNQFGCDSIVVTTLILAPTDTVLISILSCDPNDAGTSSVSTVNQFGCDSTIITTITYDPTAVDTTVLTSTNCDPTQTGSSQMLFAGADGCDSLVISMVTLAPSDSIFINTATCDPAQTGTFTQNLTNQFGCDSTVVTTVTLLPSDATNLSATTCDPSQTGTFTQNLTNQFGCDSTVVTTVTLLPSDATNLSATTCDPAQAGTFVQNLTNQFGCDSTVVTTVTLLPSDATNISATTCDPAQAGTFVQNLTNQFGCDSTVVTTISLLLSDTTNLSQSTCDPAQAGTFVQNLTNQFGCDSVVFTLVTIDLVACAPVGQITGTPTSCGGVADGTFTITVTSGQVPLQYSWPGGNGTINNLNVPVTETGLAPGAYSLTLTDAFGLTSTLSVTLNDSPGLSVAVNALNIHSGFTVRCAGDADGTVGSEVTGGTAPFSYLWNTGGTASTLVGVGAGLYSLTVTDSNGCTGIGSAEATGPAPLGLEVATALPDCGDVTVGALATTSGGVPPLNIFVNNQQQSGNNLALINGSNTVSVQDAYGCRYDTVVAVNLPPIPQVVLPADVTLALGESITVEALANVAVYDTLLWTPLPDPGCAGCPVQEFQPFENLTLTVTLMDTTGCEDTDEMRIVVQQRADIFVPNVFSPNDDGREDFFTVNAGSSVVELQEVAIFDRWGDKLYFWDNPLPPNEWPGWDGKTADKDVSPGVFVYYLKIKLADGSTQVIDGDVTLVR